MSVVRLIGLIFTLAVTITVGWLTAPYYEALVRYVQYGKGPCDFPATRVCWHKPERPHR